MKLVFDRVLPAKTGYAVELKKGQHLRIIDVEGKQVVDMAVFNRHNLREKLSTSYSRTRGTKPDPNGHGLANTLSEGDRLMSTIANPMMTIVADTAEPKGTHDFHVRMCNRKLYELNNLPVQDGCMETIAKAVAPYGLLAEDLPDPMNVFMRMPFDPESGRWIIHEPVTKPGDYIEFRAEIDCLVGFSNCPEDQLQPVNAFHCTPVQIQIYDPS